MGKEDALKERIATRRELLKSFFLLLIATLSGSFAVLYKVAIKETDLTLLIIFASGITASAFLSIILVKLFKEMETLSEELENE